MQKTPPTASPSGLKVSILLVDDNPADLLALRSILDNPEYDLVEAHTGEEAVRLLNKEDFGVVLINVRIPGLKGLVTARQIREQRRSAHIPIIFLSAYESDQRTLEEAYSIGAVDYLVKPLVARVLKAKVAGFAELFRDKRQAERQAEQLRLLIEGTTEYAIFMLDPCGNVITWNAGAERITQYRADEIIGRHFSCFYRPEDARSGSPEQALQQALAQGEYEEDGWRVRKDGSQLWASVVTSALRDETGVLRGFSKVTRDMTERKVAEEKERLLLQSEAGRQAAEKSALEARDAQREERKHREQLHVTLSSIGDAVIVTDTSGNVTFLNPVAQSLTGWDPQDAAGRPLEEVFQIINEETRQTVESPVSKVLRDGITVGLANHTVLISRDGREMLIDDSGAPIRGEGGTIAGVVLVFRDVTESRRAMEARLRLAAIVESSDDAIISKNLNGIITSWNQGAERLFGYKAEEMIGKPLSIIVPPDHPNELPQLLNRLRKGERIDHFRTVRLRKDGTRVDVSLMISPIKNDEGEIVGASKIARDITEAKRKEEALRFLAEASKLLAELLDVPNTLQKIARMAVPFFADWCGVDLLEPDGSLNRLAAAHVDPAKVALAMELQRRYPPDPKATIGVWNVIRTGKPELLSEIPPSLLEQSVPDERYRNILSQLGLRSYIGVPLILRGKVLGVLSFIAAESGRTYSEADLSLAVDLAHRAAVAIENAQLYAELRETHRRKDEFLAMLAHELRNPLAPIRNALHVMKMPGADPAIIEGARQMCERQLQHLVRLVDDLLDVSRIMRGKIELRKELVDLAQVVARGVETARPVIDAQGQALIESLPEEPVLLEADPTRLAQVIGNLLNNAAKYSQRSGRIWITAQREGAEAVIRIRDEGMGIRPDLLPQIFDLFVQGDRTLERSQGGLGIGLTVVQKLVALHGGKVSAHSPGIDKGTEFIIRLPGLKDANVPAESPREAQARRGGRPTRVLVVDDNVDAAESIAMLLRLWGHHVRLAHHGPQALQDIEEDKPDLVLLDIGLPGLNGYEVARRVREKPGFSDVVLVAVTGYGQEADRKRSQAAGFDQHLVKPVAPEALRALIGTLNHAE